MGDVIFDCIRNENEYFYFPVTNGDGHTDGIIQCNKEYNLGLNIAVDDVSYSACSKLFSSINSLVLIVENQRMIAFLPPIVNQKIYSFCKKNLFFFLNMT